MHTRQRGRPRLTETAEIERAIRDAAIATLLDLGDAATMNAVAEGAGLSRKSVYARYSTKSALFTDAIRDLMEHAEPARYETSGSAEQRLFQYVRAALDLMSTPTARAIQAILSADPSYIAVLKAEMISAVQTQFHEPLQQLLQELHDAGEIVAEDIVATARMINTLIFAQSSLVGIESAGRAAPLSRDDYARIVTGFVTQGILPR